MRLENALEDNCNNEKNTNKKLLLHLEDYIVYNIFCPSKLSIVFNH